MYELNNRAVLLSKEGRLDESIALFKEALENDSDDSNINFNIALVYMKKEAFDIAAKYLEKSISIFANDDNLRELGICYIRLEEYEKARPILLGAVKDFGSSDSENVLGVLFFKLANFEEAKRHFEIATKLNSKNRDAWFNLKDALLELGMKREAKMAQYNLEQLENHEI